MAQMFKDHVRGEVARTVERMKMSMNVKQADFTNMLTSAAKALKCDEACVTSCANTYWAMDQKTTCLDRCGCYRVAPQYPPANGGAGG